MTRGWDCHSASGRAFGLGWVKLEISLGLGRMGVSVLKSLSESFGTSRTKPPWRAYTQKQMYTTQLAKRVFINELVPPHARS